MPRFFYRPLPNVQPGPGLGAGIAQGFAQGVDNFFATRGRLAEDKLRRDELARQHEREDFADSLMRAEAGIEEGPAPLRGIDIFEGQGVGMQPGTAERKSLSPFRPGPAAALFAGPAKLNRPADISGTIDFNSPMSESGLEIRAPQGAPRAPAPTMLERYAASGPDADYTSFRVGDKQYHMLRPEVRAARERRASSDAAFADLQRETDFRTGVARSNAEYERGQEDARFGAAVGPAAAALASRYGGRLTPDQVDALLRASRETGLDLDTLLPEMPYDSSTDEEYQRALALRKWDLAHPDPRNPQVINAGDGQLAVVGPDGTVTWSTAPGGAAETGEPPITLNQALGRVRQLYPSYAGELRLEPDIELLFAQRLVEGIGLPRSEAVDTPEEQHAFRQSEAQRTMMNRRARAPRAVTPGAAPAGQREPAAGRAGPAAPPGAPPAASATSGPKAGGVRPLSDDEIERLLDAGFSVEEILKRAGAGGE